MHEPDTVDGFLDKWRARWPEWRVAEAFVPEAQRRTAVAWFALLQELAEAAWGGADPTPGLAKLAWWQEELQGWAKGARRHPLGGLQRLPAPWAELARTLNLLPATRGQAPEQALPAVADFAAALARCEGALFAPAHAGEAAADAPRPDLAAARLLGERVLQTAAHEEAGWLLQRWPRPGGAPRPARVHGALLRARLAALRQGDGVRPVSAWRVPILAWRAARAG